ncbi:MAG: transposase [Thermotogota bacterium]|nr:transposase [Thermotogota bacterium]
MGIIYQKNKQTGITYAYENKAHWDKDKQQSQAKRKLIGKLDPETGEIVPTRAYKKKSDSVMVTPAKKGPLPITTIKRSFYGATYLFDQIGDILGIRTDLKTCFPEVYKQILSIAYYLILEEDNPLGRFPHWQKTHRHPYGQDLPSQRSTDLFQSIDEASRMMFFQKQGKRRLEKEYWALDTTSISSYSEVLKQVKLGKNKEHDHLPQLNLALLFGEESGLPFYYRKLPGNITDVSTIRELMEEFDVMGYKKVKLVLDRGFYSKKNINALYQHRKKFIVGTKLNLTYVKTILDEDRENLKLWTHLQGQFNTNGICRPFEWDYEQERPYKGDVLKEKRRAYLLVFYNPEKAAKDQVALNEHLMMLQNRTL